MSPRFTEPVRVLRARSLALVAFGESDRIVTPAYGRAVADAIPGAEFAEVPAAGHLPHLENPGATWAVIDPFLAASR